MFTDASITHWSAVVTQVPNEQLDLPLNQQQHELLLFMKGRIHWGSGCLGDC
jgi:hypothetical protein